MITDYINVNLFVVRLMTVSKSLEIFLSEVLSLKILFPPEIMCKNRSSCCVVAERSSALDSSSGVVKMWVRIPTWPIAALVSLSKTLNHNCFVLRMGREVVGPVCCVMHVKEPRTLIVKEKGLAPVFLDSRPEHPAGWICARYKSSVLLLIFTDQNTCRFVYNFVCERHTVIS